jgi:hypothetical protein
LEFLHTSKFSAVSSNNNFHKAKTELQVILFVNNWCIKKIYVSYIMLTMVYNADYGILLSIKVSLFVV